MSNIRRSSRANVRQVESLEDRNLLAGHGFGGGFAQLAAMRAQFAGDFHSVPPIIAQLATRGDMFGPFGAHHGAQTVLTAQLADSESGATGSATFKTYTEDGETETQFKVSVTGAAADTALDVTVAGVVVGQITTDSSGAGTLKLSSDPKSDEQALPDNFPTAVAADTAVSVGTIAGTLAERTFGGGGCAGGDAPTARTQLAARLTDSQSGATATVRYHSITRDDETVTRLAVHVKGAAADSTLDVSIGDVVVGQVATDSTGSGKLVLSSDPQGDEQPLPANFPTDVAADTAVTVGTMTGTLSTTPDHFGRYHGGFRRR